MTAYPTDPVLIAPAAPNLIYLKYALTFIFIDPKSNPGTFSFQMDTDPSGTLLSQLELISCAERSLQL